MRPQPVLLAAVLALAVGAACAGSAGGAGSGIQGVVLLGPQCPVVQEGSPCPDKPFEGTVIVSTESGRLITTARSGADGRFRVPVEPGTYVVTVADLEGINFAKPATVAVSSGRMAEVTLLVDTGIRGPVEETSGY